jgi:hypothetical protein
VSSKKKKGKEKGGQADCRERKMCACVPVCVFVFVIGTVRNECQCKIDIIVEEITHRKDCKN